MQKKVLISLLSIFLAVFNFLSFSFCTIFLLFNHSSFLCKMWYNFLFYNFLWKSFFDLDESVWTYFVIHLQIFVILKGHSLQMSLKMEKINCLMFWKENQFLGDLLIFTIVGWQKRNHLPREGSIWWSDVSIRF